MKRQFIYGILAAITCFTLSCQHASDADENSASPTGNQFANGFQIKHVENDVLLTVKNPWQNAEDITYEYCLSRSGKGKNSIKIPVQRVACMSTTHVAYINQLGHADKIIALSGTDYVYDENIRKRIENKSVKELGFSENMNLETLIQLKPDVLFAYVISPAELPQLQQLQEMGIPVIMVGDYLEQHPLGKMEWIRFFSYFFDETDRGNAFADEIIESYSDMKKRSKLMKTNPMVMLNIPWQGVWWTPGADSYMAQFIRDASGRYLFQDLKGNESQAVDMEVVYQRASDVNVWLNPGSGNTRRQVFHSDNRLQYFENFDSIRIYNNNRRVGENSNDFYESGVLRPDLILSDLYRIFHAENLNSDSLTYYQILK
ncbi:MAG: ABC transporter substrate-binding protein [Bacteroidota bacterium]|nr:ABC transporter substrate-binding protein [Bacteroidota bacterium]